MLRCLIVYLLVFVSLSVLLSYWTNKRVHYPHKHRRQEEVTDFQRIRFTFLRLPWLYMSLNVKTNLFSVRKLKPLHYLWRCFCDPKLSRFGRTSTYENKKHVGPIRHCEPPHALILHCHSPGVATVARCHCHTPPAHRCPRQRQRVTEGTAMAP